MNKGKVIDIQKKYAVVLNDQMAYEKIERKTELSLGKEIYYFNEDVYKESRKSISKYFLVAAVLFMMLFIQPLLVAEEAYGYISVDINPSLQLEVNKNLKVLDIEAINDDGKVIIKDEWIGKNAKDVINLIIEETKNKGFLNQERDFVLVSYFFNDEDNTSEEVFVQSLDQLFNEKPIDYEVAVIRSNAKNLAESKEAKESIGKQIVNKKMKTEVKDLLSAKESIEKDKDFKIYKKNVNEVSNDKALEDNPGQKNEKNPIFGERDDVPGFIDNDGKNESENENKNKDEDNSEKDYRNTRKMISPPEAKAIAFELVNGKVIEIDLDRDNSEAEYEIKIVLENQEHRIIIDGFTGEIIAHEIEDVDNEDEDKDKDEDEETNEDQNNQSNRYRDNIGREEAKNIAFRIVGSEGIIIDFDQDDEEEYKFEIESKGEVHQIEINAFTGEIIKHEVEQIDVDEENEDKEIKEDEEDEEDEDVDKVIIDDTKENEPLDSDEYSEIVDRSTVEEIIFNEVSENAEIIEFELENQDDEAEYKVKLEYDGEIHELIINGFTGEIIEHEVDFNDIEIEEDKEINDSKEESEEFKRNQFNNIIEEKAIEEIIFNEIGEGKIIELDFDRNDDEAEYIVEMIYDNRIHELIIDGFTGEIIKHDISDEEDDDE